MQMYHNTIFNFNKNSDLHRWEIVNDSVMGGNSRSGIKLDLEGNGIFSGIISLENKGGFSSIHYKFNKKRVQKGSKIFLKVKGDQKRYQLRIKNNSKSYYSYITHFETNGAWQEIEISIKDMYPQYRGKKLNQPNFSYDYIEQLSILIANKKAENFRLLIDKIEIK